MSYLENLLHLKALNTMLKKGNLERRVFRQRAANFQLYHTKIMEDIKRLDTSRITIQVDGMNRENLLDALQLAQQSADDLDYNNVCECTLTFHTEDGERSPRLFIVLPDDLEAWDDSNPSTHRFRLYYMCSINSSDSKRENLHMHMHLADHPGYSLNRQQEFFQKYGDYVLRMLGMIRRGFSDEETQIPPLDSAYILWNYGADGNLSQKTIGPLVDKTIKYLENLSVPKWYPRLYITRTENFKIKQFLDMQEGDSAEGNLYRYMAKPKGTFWMCQEHACSPQSYNQLRNLDLFVRSIGGHVDIPQATIRVDLRSRIDLDRFCSLLRDSNHTFGIYIKMNSKESQSQITRLFSMLGSTRVLEINGFGGATPPQAYIHYASYLLTHQAAHKFIFVNLLNCPRQQEQCIYIPTPTCDLIELQKDVDDFRQSVEGGYAIFRKVKRGLNFQQALTKHGWSKLSLLGIHLGNYHVVLDLRKLADKDAYLFHTNIVQTKIAVASWECLQQATFVLTDSSYDSKDAGVKTDLAHLYQTPMSTKLPSLQNSGIVSG